MAIIIERSLDQLNAMLAEIEHFPEDAEEIKRRYLRDVIKSESSLKISVLSTILSKIYDFDHNALKKDLSKVLLLKGEKLADEQERVSFLQCIMGTIEFYTKGDYSSLFNYIDSLCYDEDEDYDYADLPYT